MSESDKETSLKEQFAKLEDFYDECLRKGEFPPSIPIQDYTKKQCYFLGNLHGLKEAQSMLGIPSERLNRRINRMMKNDADT